MNYFQACVISSNFSAYSFLVFFLQYQVVSSHTYKSVLSQRLKGTLLEISRTLSLCDYLFSVASKNSDLYLL